jgi:hypothetical protein
MMQSAAFILNIADSVAMVAVRAGCAVIMGSGHGGLAFEQVRGVVGHRRHDAGNLGDQKQPEQPRAQAAERLIKNISARSARGCAWILVGNEPLTSLLACRPTAYINVV